MNQNKIATDKFSNPESEKLYMSQWENDPEIYEQFYANGKQCGGCSFYAPFNSDWGLCCHQQSQHHLETIFEHFTCRKYVGESWESHSFIDINLYPELQKQRDMQNELSEYDYKKIMQLAKQQDSTPHEIVFWILHKALFESKDK